MTGNVTRSIIAVISASLLVAVFHYWLLSRPPLTLPVVTATAPKPVVRTEAAAVAKLAATPLPTVVKMPTDIALLMARGDHEQARAALMAMAQHAVAGADTQQLAEALTLLGMSALEEPNLDAAQLFFEEALEVYREREDDVGAAHVYMQIGRLHFIVRQRARNAAAAYDDLLIARWNISQGGYYEAEAGLRQSIEDNLALNRFGAAASAYESLIRVYTGIGDTFQAEEASLSAIRLHAASGQHHRAEQLLATLRRQGIDAGREYEINEQMQALNAEFEASVHQIARARDYRTLFNHYMAKGDRERAWRFRMLANQSLSGVSKRAMYRRQPDVLVQLYDSNNSMALARQSLAKASHVFEQTGMHEITEQIRRIEREIY